MTEKKGPRPRKAWRSSAVSAGSRGTSVADRFGADFNPPHILL